MDDKTAVVPVRTTRKRRLTALAGLLLAAGAVTACGSGGGSTGASASMSTAPSASASPSPSASPSTSASASPSQSAGGAPTVSTPRPTASPSNPGIASGEPDPSAVKLPAIGYQIQGLTLTVFFYGGTCDQYGLKVDESKAGQVNVRVVITQTAPRGRECPALVKKNAVTAQLTHALVGRTVVDQATGQQVPLDAGTPGGPQ